MKRDEFNYVSQGAAMYVSNPINSILDDQIEYGRAQSRGAVDYDKIVRQSLYSDAKSNNARDELYSPKKSNGFIKMTDNKDDYLTVGGSKANNFRQVHSPEQARTGKIFGRIARHQIRTASQNIRPSRLGQVNQPGAFINTRFRGS